MLNFSEGTETYVYILFLHIPPHWHDTGSWNPFSKTKNCLFYMVNIMGDAVLATQGARASATMIFTMLNRINYAPAGKGSITLYILNVCRNYIMYWHLTFLIPAWISNYNHYKVWDEITYAFPNLNSVTVEVCEWINNLISQFTGHVITYPCWD